MSEEEHSSQETATNEPGPREATDDSTKSDMGLPGPPAQSATPVGQGEGPGVGVDEAAEDGTEDDDPGH